MTQFRGMMDAVNAGLFGSQGELIPYTRWGSGTTSNITAIVTTEGFNDRHEDDGQTRVLVGSLIVKSAEVPDPEQGDAIVFEGFEWKVDEIGEYNRQGGTFTLGIKRTIPLERSAANYRRRR